MRMTEDAAATAEERRLFDWVERVCGGTIARSVQASGGNRARSWGLDVSRGDGTTAEVFLRYSLPRPPSVEPYTAHREAQVYRVIDSAGVQAPRLIAEHPDLPALLTDRAAGIAEFRRLKDPAAKTRIVLQFIQNLARLHELDVAGVRLDGGVDGARIADHVRAEIRIWRAMYEETVLRDPLIEFAFRWLEAAMPVPDGPPVLVHGDAGPGNFLFEDDSLTALIDWEFAHLGDPMEDLAWFSMRCVMEPTPDFNGALRAYAAHSGRALDRFRILYHRVLVSARVVVIRHRNVTGEPGNAIVSRALNRRLLVQAIAEAAGATIRPAFPPAPPPTARGDLYGQVLDQLRDVVAARSPDRAVVSAAKAASKVIKYLSAFDRYGAALEATEIEALAGLLGDRPGDLASGRARLGDALEQGAIAFQPALDFFALQTAGEALLAADASGGIAARGYPAFQIAEPQ
jgi:aminoglycoside phosphotransferase (APT) family kinase protein